MHAQTAIGLRREDMAKTVRARQVRRRIETDFAVTRINGKQTALYGSNVTSPDYPQNES